MLVKAKNFAEKFVKSKNLVGTCDIECKLHEGLTFIKGTIYVPFLINDPKDEILKVQYVHSVFKFTRKIDGQPKLSGVILVTFDLYNLPSKLDVSWNTDRVREYIPIPMRCKTSKLSATQPSSARTRPRAKLAVSPHTPAPCTRTQ